MPQLGTKHECVECGTRFYDLGRSAAVCPGCGTDQNAVARETDEEETEDSKARHDLEPPGELEEDTLAEKAFAEENEPFLDDDLLDEL